ncbi:response regulator [Pelagicoccus sp. SDUM812003]|uniref:response regulator n=1 Tax=Pelagicoccus sp. SDUM812003 TaxID=3041267 RepID=UPI00280CEBDB|nr:response regulator [Pelagicoccus sp. SDUM812003]MDQ8203274.1 response regulator [Pelagicoccus sp. SDUM812003]
MPLGAINTILVVDDNLGARRSIEALLSHESYEILLAENGLSAIEIAKARTPDIILLDVMMPGMSGFEVCQEIRRDQRLSEIPIIMITALDDEESMIQGIEAGADDFLPKPISKIELRSRVKGILRLNRFRKLCDERQKFELVVRQSNFGYIVMNPQLQILFANPAARKFLAIPEPSPSNLDFFDIASDQYAVQPRDAKQQLLGSTSLPDPPPFILVKSNVIDGESQWVQATVQSLGSASSNQLLLKLEDITEKIISFQEKHTFSRMISHKLLTPLNALKAASQLMDTFKGESAQGTRLDKVLDLQRQGISRLEYDVQSILAFLESSSHANTDHPRASVGETRELMNRIAENPNFDLSLSMDDTTDEAPRIGISIHAFEACVREIVENAIKFKNGPRARINCFVDTLSSPEVVTYRFQNNSKPLSEVELANVWKPYWQADRYSTGEIQGMGLGLSLIATNVWSAGGTCKIENCPIGDGVQLSLSFPITK